MFDITRTIDVGTGKVTLMRCIGGASANMEEVPGTDCTMKLDKKLLSFISIDDIIQTTVKHTVTEMEEATAKVIAGYMHRLTDLEQNLIKERNLSLWARFVRYLRHQHG